MVDLSETIAPASDQLDAVDLLGGPQTFTIEQVSRGNAEQPVNIKLAEFPRPWRPGKSMRRVLVAVWGKDGQSYVGKRLTLYCDPDVRFGGQAVGGTRISHMSHIDKPKTVPLIISRGKSQIYTVKPLTAEPTSIPSELNVTPEQVAACTDVNELRDMWGRASEDVQALIRARVEELKGASGEGN